MNDHKPTTDRRNLLKGALAAGILAGVGPSVFGDEPRESSGGLTGAKPDLIRAENEKPGASDWRLSNFRIDPKTKYRSPAIEGYCSHNSIRAGEKLAIMVSANPASSFVIDIYRMGYYGGTGARHMRRLGPLDGVSQPDPDIGPDRVRECRWTPAVELTIPADWASGVYLGKLTAENEGLQSYVIFLVRDDRRCDFLFQTSDATWCAYNRWPDSWSMYISGKKKNSYIGPGVKASMDRPYAMYSFLNHIPPAIGSGEFLLWEFPLAYWMEKEGYDVSYISNVDTHVDGPGLMRAKAFLSVGHDEYWSREMYDNVLGGIKQGLNVAFLGGDTCWGVIPFQPSSSGAPRRVIERVGAFGGVDPLGVPLYPELAKFTQIGPDPADMIGARVTFPWVRASDWICSDEKNWIYEGTGMKDGDRIKNLIGWEFLGTPAEIPGLRVVARGKITEKNQEGEYTATIYPGPKNNWVFNAPTIWWSQALSSPTGFDKPFAYNASPPDPDARVQRITANLFDRFRNG